MIVSSAAIVVSPATSEMPRMHAKPKIGIQITLAASGHGFGINVALNLTLVQVFSVRARLQFELPLLDSALVKR